jgi:hypothetical protein
MAASPPELKPAAVQNAAAESKRAPAHRVFLLSPADCSGLRARLLQRPDPTHDLGRRLHGEEGAPVGEVFAFVSSLYFRGKLAYARAFARPPEAGAGVHVITPCDGLIMPDAMLRVRDLKRYGRVNVDVDEPRYRRPLVRHLEALATTWLDTEVVLLGSVASPKYVQLLTAVLGERVSFPSDFVGRGDMSRGGLMLRCVSEGRELSYVPLVGAVRRGPRPARLPPARPRASEVG